MKKLSTLFTMGLIAMLSLTLSSCDEDQEIAMNLQGYWEGYLSDGFYNRRWGSYGNDRFYTRWYFDGDLGSRAGRGWEEDYNRFDRKNSGRMYFHYYVKDETIKITYDDDRYDPVYIYRFSLDDYRRGYDQFFEGYIDDGGKQVYFRLISYTMYYAKQHKASAEEKD